MKAIILLTIVAIGLLLTSVAQWAHAAGEPVRHSSYTLVIVYNGYNKASMAAVSGYSSEQTCLASANYMRDREAVRVHCLLVE